MQWLLKCYKLYVWNIIYMECELKTIANIGPYSGDLRKPYFL